MRFLLTMELVGWSAALIGAAEHNPELAEMGVWMAVIFFFAAGIVVAFRCLGGEV